MEDNFIVWVKDLDDSSVPLAGSKVARLGELKKMKLKVPEGFVVTTDAFNKFLTSNNLEKKIKEKIKLVTDKDNLAQVECVSEEIRNIIEESDVPEQISIELKKAYEELSFNCLDINIPTAVRSSATGEDSAESSFAGQFDTYLGVSGQTRLVETVRKCWSSLFTARALSYRLKNNLSHEDSPMAVGVLELIHARVSGVAFSIHPVTGSKDRMVIEGNWGWGESVVQGVVTPDHIEVGKTDLRILEHQISNKKIVSAFDYSEGLVLERKMPKLFRDAAILNEEEILSICKAVKIIEKKYGYPVDVEWVVDRNRKENDPITIVQTRPETVHSHKNNNLTSQKWDPVAYAKKYAFKNLP